MTVTSFTHFFTQRFSAVTELTSLFKTNAAQHPPGVVGPTVWTPMPDQPGPGFLGEYTMQFARPDGSKIPVRVSIAPKRY